MPRTKSRNLRQTKALTINLRRCSWYRSERRPRDVTDPWIQTTSARFAGSEGEGSKSRKPQGDDRRRWVAFVFAFASCSPRSSPGPRPNHPCTNGYDDFRLQGSGDPRLPTIESIGSGLGIRPGFSRGIFPIPNRPPLDRSDVDVAGRGNPLER